MSRRTVISDTPSSSAAWRRCSTRRSASALARAAMRRVLRALIESRVLPIPIPVLVAQEPEMMNQTPRPGLRPLRLHHAPSADDRGDGTVRVGLAGRPGADGEAHDPQALPLRAGSHAGAVGLDARDHLAGEDVVRRIVAAEAHHDLVELYLVENADAGFLAQRLRHAAR